MAVAESNLAGATLLRLWRREKNVETNGFLGLGTGEALRCEGVGFGGNCIGGLLNCLGGIRGRLD